MKNNRKINIIKAGISIIMCIILVSTGITIAKPNDSIPINNNYEATPLDETIFVPDDYPTITEAIAHAESDDIIYVRSGIYVEHLTIDIQISLIGENRETTIIDGGYQPGDIISINADGVIISGFTIQHCTSNWGDAGIDIRSNNNVISNNIIQQTERAIIMVSCSGNTLSNNILTGNSFGNMGYPLYLSTSGGNTIIGNSIIENGYTGICLVHSNSNIIKENIISDNEQGGLFFSESSQNTILKNSIVSNDIAANGIDLRDGSNQNTIRENTIAYNDGIGINCWESSSNIIFYNNMIENTVRNVLCWRATNTWDNGYPEGGNYWSDYIYDGIGLYGIGEPAYQIDQENQDRYPLIDELIEYVENIQGIVQYNTIEGGFFGIITDDGQHLDPANLPSDYRIHGLNVEFTGRIVNYPDTHMWGDNIYFLNIRQRGQIRDESYMSFYYEGVYKSLYSGTSWFPVNTGLPCAGHGQSHPVFCLAGGRQAGLERGELYAGTQSGVYKTTNGGGSWFYDGLIGQHIRDFDIVPQTGKVYAATNHGLYARDPITEEWEIVAFFHEADSPEIPLNAVNVLHVSVCYAEPNVIYVAGYQFRCRGTWVYKSTDGGVTWTTSDCIFRESGSPAGPKELAVNKFDSNYAFVGALGDSIFLHYYARTVDESETWLYDGPDEFLSTIELVADPVRPGVVYIAIFDPVGSSIWKSVNNGDSWNELSTWSFGMHTFLVTHPTNGNTLYTAFTTSDENIAYGTFGKTSNNGQTWHFYNQGLPYYIGMAPRVTGFLVDLPTGLERREITIASPVDGESWRVGSTQLIQWESSKEVSDKVIISISTDSGATWKKIGTASNKVGINYFKWTVSDKYVSKQCRIKIDDIALLIPSKEAMPYDISANDFIIKLK